MSFLSMLTPALLAALASLALMGAAALLWQRQLARDGLAGRIEPVGPRLSRQGVGLAAGGVLAGLILLLVLGSGAAGPTRLMGLVGAGVVFGVVGISLPRLPQMRAEREARTILLSLPPLMRHLSASLQTESLTTAYDSYTRYPQKQRRVLQGIIAAAITSRRTMETLADAVARVAKTTRSAELAQITDLLTRAERGQGTGSALEILRETGLMLDHQLEQEHLKLVSKRKMMVIGATGFSLVIGLLGGILYIAIAGSNTQGVF